MMHHSSWAFFLSISENVVAAPDAVVVDVVVVAPAAVARGLGRCFCALFGYHCSLLACY